MTMKTAMPQPLLTAPPWVPLRTSFAFLCRHPPLLLLSLGLVVLTGALTWAGYLVSMDLINQVTGSFFTTPPQVERFWHWPLLWGWTALKWIFLVLSRVVAFYLAFLLAYCLTSPGNVVLSTWAGNRYCDKAGEGEAALTLTGILIDLREGLKIGGLGLLVTVAALMANVIPIIGQVAAFVLYVFYSALMFVDFPSSRYRWTLGRKLRWVAAHRQSCFRLGLLPAVISMIPLVNVFLMALFLPLLTIHTTLNFLTIEGRKEPVPVP